MANYSTGTATGTGATDAFHVILRAAMNANGWTEADVISNTTGSRDIVWKGAQLDATADLRPWVRTTQSGNALNFIGYSDFDTTTHTGINAASSGSNATLTLQDASFSYILFVNGFAACICAKISSAWNHTYIGFLRRGLVASKSGITKTTGTNAIGVTSIAVASDMQTKLKAGQKVWIMNSAHASGNANAAHCEQITLSAVGASTLTSSALVTAFDTGAIIAQNACPLLIASFSSASTMAGTGYSPFNPDTFRSSATAQTATYLDVYNGTEANVDPEDGTGEYGSGFWTVTSAVASHTGFKGYPYGYYVCAGGTQSIDDIMDDGTYTYVVLATSASGDLIIGPREV